MPVQMSPVCYTLFLLVMVTVLLTLINVVRFGLAANALKGAAPRGAGFLAAIRIKNGFGAARESARAFAADRLTWLGRYAAMAVAFTIAYLGCTMLGS